MPGQLLMRRQRTLIEELNLASALPGVPSPIAGDQCVQTRIFDEGALAAQFRMSAMEIIPLQGFDFQPIVQ
jgi:hypothetical protein